MAGGGFLWAVGQKITAHSFSCLGILFQLAYGLYTY